MIYRILIGLTDDYYDPERQRGVSTPLPLVGAGATLSGRMWELGLPAPRITNPRARFWFTEAGWDRFGRAVARQGRQRGSLIQIIRRKQPRPSQIVYRDAWQLALLPDTRRR